MPLGSFGSPLGSGASLPDVLDALARLQKEVTYLLNGGLDTLNVNELSADVINAGTLNAALVAIQSALTGATITIDGNGFKAVYTSGVTITIDQNGFKINNGTTDVFTVDPSGVANFAGNITTNANINVGTDVHVGQSLYLNPTNLLSTFYLTPSIYIYADVPANTLRLVAPDGVYANGIRIDV